MKEIAVIFGGKSVEHDISVITALQTMKSICGYKVLPIYIKPDGQFVTAQNLTKPQTYLNYAKNVKKEREVIFDKSYANIVKNKKIVQKIKIDCALLCTHGHGGEDGALQGMLEMCDIPYSSCKVASSAMCMDKTLTKALLQANHIKSPAYVHFDICQYKAKKIDILKEIKDKIKLPCIIKPANGGSSVGISICEDITKIESCIDEAFLYDDKIIVEKYIEKAHEFCCGVVKIASNIITSNVNEVKKGKIYTFTEKYLSAKEQEKKKIDTPTINKVKRLAEKTYKALDCDGVVRVDFLYDQKDNILYVNELNTIPGSLAFNLFPFPFADLMKGIIEEAISYHNSKGKLVYSFSSEAIEKYIDMTDHLKYKMR